MSSMLFKSHPDLHKPLRYPQLSSKPTLANLHDAQDVSVTALPQMRMKRGSHSNSSRYDDDEIVDDDDDYASQATFVRAKNEARSSMKKKTRAVLGRCAGGAAAVAACGGLWCFPGWKRGPREKEMGKQTQLQGEGDEGEKIRRSFYGAGSGSGSGNGNGNEHVDHPCANPNRSPTRRGRRSAEKGRDSFGDE